MFWEKFFSLCQSIGKSPNTVCKELGFSNATATHWKNQQIPNGKSMNKLADYFGVSVDYLLGNTDEIKKACPFSLTEAEAAFLEIIRSLNAQGQQKIMDYSRDLLSSGQYGTATIKIAAKGRGAHTIEMDAEQVKALKKALADLPDE